MSIEDAAIDIRYLLNRGFPQKGVVGFVCDHYRMDSDSRHILSRAVIARSICEKRRLKFLPCDKIRGNKVIIDGYNIIIGMESILEKKAILCDDGVIRDIKGVSRNFSTSGNTDHAIELILSFLKEKYPSQVCFLFDSQISKSGSLAGLLREKIDQAGLMGEAGTSRNVDHDLKFSHDIVASSDGIIIDSAEKVINFLFCMICEIPRLEAGISRINEFTG
ncbi:MAG: DUF434 domain-containing protein [Candidatus Methanoperedens sp.]